MVFEKPCTHGRALCGIYKGTREFTHKADDFLKHYGDGTGKVLQGIAPAVGVGFGPVAGIATAGLGHFAQEYANVRNEMEN